MKASRLSVVFLFAVLTSSITRAQSSAELTNQLKAVSAALKTVPTADRTYAQTMMADGQRPYLLAFKTTQTDKKGVSKDLAYELNLSDIDANGIIYEPKKDVIQVTLKTNRGVDFIREKEADQTTGYTDRILLYAENVDNARALAEALRKAVPMATKLTDGRLQIGTGPDALANWLKTNVVTATSGPETYQQSASPVAGGNPLKMRMVQQKTGAKSSPEDVYELNLGDLDEKTVELTVKGQWLLLEASTRNRNSYIRAWRDGKPQSNGKAVSFYFADLEKARDGRAVLQKLLPAAAQKQRDMAPAYGSSVSALKTVSAAVRDVGAAEGRLGQKLTADCGAVLTLDISGKTAARDEYRFNWADLNEKSVKISASGKGFFTLSVGSANRTKYVEHRRNDQLQNYTDEIEILAEDIETLRYLPTLLEKAIVECRAARKVVVPAGALPAKVAYIAQRVPASVPEGKNTLSQTLDVSGGCALKLTQSRNDGKKSTELIYELNLVEIDPGQVQIEVSGAELSVVLATRNKQKIIKTYKNGTPDNYVPTVSIRVGSIEAAMQMQEALRQATELCR
jgi:hypothetical protein